MKKRMTVVSLVAIAILMVGGAAYAVLSWTRHTTISVTSASVAEPTLKITGEVTGLLPGNTGTVAAVVGNTNDFPVRITSITGGSAATTSGCPEWAIRVVAPAKSDPALVIPRRSTRKVAVKVEMETWADQKCAGQEFALDLVTTIGPA